MKTKRIVGAVVALTVAGAVAWLITRAERADSSDPPLTVVAWEAREPDREGIVRLTAAKRTDAPIRTVLVERQTLRLTRTLPARFVYDDTRHVAVRAPSEGVLEGLALSVGSVADSGAISGRVIRERTREQRTTRYLAE